MPCCRCGRWCGFPTVPACSGSCRPTSARRGSWVSRWSDRSEALMTLARGDSVLPLRTMVRLPDRPGLLGLMPAYLGSPRVMGLKAVTVMPGNHGTVYDSHQGAVLIFEVEHGCPLAVIDGTSVTAIRTAAVSGVAARALAREDAGDLAIL